MPNDMWRALIKCRGGAVGTLAQAACASAVSTCSQVLCAKCLYDHVPYNHVPSTLAYMHCIQNKHRSALVTSSMQPAQCTSLTLAPVAPRAMAIALPIPREAPVTRHTGPSVEHNGRKRVTFACFQGGSQRVCFHAQRPWWYGIVMDTAVCLDT